MKSQFFPSLVLGLSLALAVAVSTASAATVVQTWGSGTPLGLGDGTVTSASPVSPVGLPSEISAVGAGATAAFAIDGDGALWSWGENQYGFLGNGTTTSSDTPAIVSSMTSGVTKVAGGYDATYALKDGSFYAWGRNNRRQLGIGAVAADQHAPVPVNVLTNVSAFSAGAQYALAVQDGALYSWGYYFNGRTGLGVAGNNTSNANQPTAVSSLSSGVTAVSAGPNFGFAIQEGALYTWGSNQPGGQLGLGAGGERIVPNAVSDLSSGVTAISAGAAHALAIKDGNVYAWGHNGSGRLGDGTTENKNVPQLVLDLDVDIVAVANYGSTSSYALAADGNLWVWGNNQSGQLGLGDFVDRHVPTQLASPSGYRYTSIASGSSFAIATLTAVPEPSATALLTLGGVGMAALRRRRR